MCNCSYYIVLIKDRNTKIVDLEAQISCASSSAAYLKRAKEEVTGTLGIPQKIIVMQNGLTFGILY